MIREKKFSPAGAEIVGALTEFHDALKEGYLAVEKNFTVRTVEFQLASQSYTGKEPEQPHDETHLITVDV
jgi:hypothetical protein